MKIGDIAALITGGRSVSEVKEIAEIEKSNPDVVTLAKTGTSMQDLKDLINLADTGTKEPEEHPADTAESEQATQEQTIDYAALYKEAQEKINALESTVKQIQKTNASINVANDVKSIQATIEDMFADF